MMKLEENLERNPIHEILATENPAKVKDKLYPYMDIGLDFTNNIWKTKHSYVDHMNYFIMDEAKYYKELAFNIRCALDFNVLKIDKVDISKTKVQVWEVVNFLLYTKMFCILYDFLNEQSKATLKYIRETIYTKDYLKGFFKDHFEDTNVKLILELLEIKL